MKIELSMHVFVLVLLMSLFEGCKARDHEVPPKANETKDEIEARLLTNEMQARMRMVSWLTAPAIREQRLDDFPRMKECTCVFNDWLHKVIALSWLPPADAKLIFFRSEVDGPGVARLCWFKNGYDIQVSQTATTFAIKLTPEGGRGTGKNDKEKLDVASQLCLRLFVEKGMHHRSQGGRLPIENLPQKIALFSFQKDTTLKLQGDENVLVGRPRTMKEEGLGQPKIVRDDSDNPNWCYTPFAWMYWFRNIYWWNDGKSIGIYLLKNEGGQFYVEMGSWKFDREWFDGDSTKGRKSNDQGE